MADTDPKKKNIKLRQTTILTVRQRDNDISDIRKQKKECVIQKQDIKKTNKPSRSSTPGRATPSSNRITNYLTVSEPNSVKKTFSSIEIKKNVSKKISMYQELGRGQACIKGSGRCATHNCKLVRKIENKKTSKIDKNGKLVWQMCEVTISVCPAAQSEQTISVNNQAVANSLCSAGNNNNKKQRLLSDYVTDQSASHTQTIDENALPEGDFSLVKI